MSESLQTYRIYSFDAALMIVSADFIKAGSSEEAIAKVQSMGFGSKCEIWNERNLIATLENERAA